MAVNGATGEVIDDINHPQPPTVPPDPRPDLEPYVAKYGERYRDLIARAVPMIVRSRPELDPYQVDAVLGPMIPPVKLPSFRMNDGSFVPATSVVVTCDSFPVAAAAMAVVVEGRDEPLDVAQLVNSGDTLNVTVSRPGPLRLPAPPAHEPTICQLLRGLADLLESRFAPDGDLDYDEVCELDAEIEAIEQGILEKGVVFA